MPNWLRALIAGLVARKLGCGCFSTIIIFVLIYFALGQCNRTGVRHSERQRSHDSGHQAYTIKRLAPPAGIARHGGMVVIAGF